MKFKNAIGQLLESYNDRICIKSDCDINQGEYCIYKVSDYPLMLARRLNNIVYPAINMDKRIESINFNIVLMDKYDENYIYNTYKKLRELMYKIELYIEDGKAIDSIRL
jgi:hypothetical protein